MTYYELLKFCGCIIEQLEKSGVKPTDHKYLRLFEEYREAKQRGEKISYVVACLAEKYGMSQRAVYNIVRRMRTDCKSGSV